MVSNELMVDALQFLKCLIWCDVIFCTDPSTSIGSNLDKDDNATKG
jgi:hypothetical protein